MIKEEGKRRKRGKEEARQNKRAVQATVS